MRIREWIVASALCATVLACRSGNSFQPSGPAPSGSVTLRVQNNNYADMDLYVVSEGLATRIGTVNGLGKDTFTLDPSFFPSGDLRIIGVPIGGNGRASSGALIVAPGQSIDFTIGAVPRQSMATVR